MSRVLHFDSWSTAVNGLIWWECQIKLSLEALFFFSSGRKIFSCDSNHSLSCYILKIIQWSTQCCLCYISNQQKAWKIQNGEIKIYKKKKCYIQLVLALLLLGLPEGWLMFALPTSVTGQLWHLRLHCGPKLKRPGFQVRWGQIQRVHVSVCVCSTRSKLPTLSPWHNRLNVMCMKWHFLSQKSAVFYWAVA